MKNKKLIFALNKCMSHCNHCADACLDEDNVKDMVTCIRLDRVCAEVCNTLSRILTTRHSDIDGLLSYCISICNDCAAECERHGHSHCRDCAAACRECAQACETFLAEGN